MSNRKSSAGLISRLSGILFKQRLTGFLAGGIDTMAAFLAAAVLLVVLAGVLILPVWLKISALVVAGGLVLFVFVRTALTRLTDGSVESVADRLETINPELDGRLIATVQFARMQDNPGYSSELMALTERKAVEGASSIDFNRALSFAGLISSAKYLAVAAFVASILMVSWPSVVNHAWTVYSHPTQEIAPPLGYSLDPIPGSTQMVKYRDIEIGGMLTGGQFPEEAIIYHRLAGGNWQRTEVVVPRGRIAAEEDSVAITTKLRQVNKSFDFYVEAGRTRTEVCAVDVVDRPRVAGLKLSVFYPRYTGLEPTVIDENNGSFSAIVGSNVNLSVETNLPVDEAALIFSDSITKSMDVSDRLAETSLQVKESQAYYVKLTDHLGENNPDPIEYYITAVPDEYPAIEVIKPGFDVNFGEEMLLPMHVRIFDDFGFSHLALKYVIVNDGQPSEEHVSMLHFSDRIKTEGDVEFTWDLDQFNLFPGDYIVYHYEVADNDEISGPKLATSRKFIARFPSMEEIIAATEAEAESRVRRTEQMLKEGRESVDRINKIARKLKAQEKDARQTDWQHQKELQSLAEKNTDLLDQLEKTAEEMNKALDESTKNSMLSRQILEKMDQIRKLFEDVATPEMREAQKKLLEALKEMDRNELQKAMDDYQMSMDEMLQRLERTLALLKKMQMEQKMEAMLRKLEQLADKQESMNEKTSAGDESELPGLGREEQKLKSDMESLKKESEGLRDLAQEAEMSESPDLNEFAEALEQTDADQDMQQMSQSLQQQDRNQAGESGKQALSKMRQMLNQMQQSLASMQHDEGAELERAMQAAIDDASQLSQQQEGMHQQSRQLSHNSMMMHDQATDQQDLKAACSGLQNRIGELGKKSPFVAGELMQLIGKARSEMDMATESLTSRRKTQAMKHQRDAMSSLNLAALRLMESLDQQKQCNNGSSCNKPTQKLNSMCNKQNSLNMQTQNQCNSPGNNPNGGQGSQRQELKRLAGEQGALRKSLEDLNREFGGSRQILGRLDAIADEMKKVEEDMADGEVGAETLERQLKIHSRLLEASRTLQRRDFTQQRQATTAKEDVFAAPPALPADLLDDRVKLEDRLRQYLSEDYPPQYEEQIKAYFRALLQSQAGKTGSTQEATSQP